MLPVHSRMPVLLGVEHWQTWLNERPLNTLQLRQLTTAAPDGTLNKRRVGAEVNRAQSDHAGLLAPVTSNSLQGDFLGDLLG
jgi:putative SOS response-associated peptidase YedK